MKIAYINGGIAISETFIYDLLLSLSYAEDVTFITSQEKVSLDKAVTCINLSYIRPKSNLEKKIFGNWGNQNKLKWDIKYVTFKCKSYFQKNKFDVAYIEYGTTAVLFHKLFCTLGIPYIVHFHGFDASSAFTSQSYSAEIQKVFNSAEHIIAPSHHIKRLLILKGADPEKISVIAYGLNTSMIKPLTPHDRYFRSNIPKVSFAGRLTDKKNPLALLKAFHIVSHSLPKAELHLIGEGPLMKACREYVFKYNLGKVTFYGALPRDQVYSIVNSSWVYAQHSVTSAGGDQEGLPNSISEAAAFGIPVVATIHSGITENVVNGITGFLVQEFDYESMAEKILYLLKNIDFSIDMGVRARKHILELCNHDNRVELIRALLKDAFQKRL